MIVPLGAVGAVIVLIVVLIGLNGHSSGKGQGPGVISATTPRVVIPSTTPSASTSVTPSTTPTPSQKPTHTALPPKPHHHASPTAMAPVRVYNTTAIQGLAHHVAAEVQARGWTVTDVGNLSGALTEVTVFYSPGAHAAAAHLESEFSGIRRIEPNSVAGFTSSGLTLVLTADWHD